MGGIYDDVGGGYPPYPGGAGAAQPAVQWPWDVPPPGQPTTQPQPISVDAIPPPPPVSDQLAGAPLPLVDAPAPTIPPPPDEQALPPMPDAISGGTHPGPQTIEESLASIGADQHAETSTERYAGDPLANPNDAERQDYLNKLAQRDPQQFAELVYRQQDEQRKVADARRTEIINRDYDEQRANLARRQTADKATQAKLDALLADAERIANTKIDPTGGVTGVKRVAGILAAVVGGLVQSRTGSATNSGLDALNAAIKHGIDVQKADLLNQREGIGHRNSTLQQELARHGDTFQAEEAMRLAALKQADSLLAIEQQNYDPRGTTALRIAGLRAGIAGQQRSALAAFQQKTFDNQMKLAEFQDKAETRRAAALKDKHDQSLGWANNALSAQRLQYDQRKDAKDFDLRTKEFADKQDERASKNSRELSIGALPRVRVDDKGSPVLDDKGMPVIDAGPLKQRDGTEFLAGDTTRTKELAAKTLSASEVTDMVNEVLDIRDRVGGESGAFNSDESQRLKVLGARLAILSKSGTQGMSSDEDMKRLTAAVGADDVTSFRARAAGLKEGRDRTAAELNKAYRIAGYNGARIEFPNPFGKTAGNTSQDDADQALLEKPKGGFAADFAHELDRRTTGLSPDELRAFGPRIGADDIERAGYTFGARNPRVVSHSANLSPEIGLPLTPAQRAAFEDVASRFDPNASTEQQRRIAELADQARGGGGDAVAARALLTKVSTSAHTVRLRELAKSALDQAVSGDVLGGEDPGISPEPVVRGTAFETVPPKGRR